MSGQNEPRVVASHVTFSWRRYIVKTERYRSITSQDIDYQRTLKSDWVTAFWPVTCDP